MFPKLILSFLILALLAACAAPVQQTSEVSETSEVSIATSAPTETPTLTPTPTQTSTPEPTATPEPTVIKTEVTFDLTNGETITMPAFILNNPSEDPKILEQQQIEVLNAVIQYMVDGGVAWGEIDGKDRIDSLSLEDDHFLRNFQLKGALNELIATNFRIPNEPEVDDDNSFLIMNIKPGPDDNPGFVFIYKNNHEGSSKRYESLFVNIFSQTISNLLKKIKIPQKP